MSVSALPTHDIQSVTIDNISYYSYPFQCVMHITRQDGSKTTEQIEANQALQILRSLTPDQNKVSPVIRTQLENCTSLAYLVLDPNEADPLSVEKNNEEATMPDSKNRGYCFSAKKAHQTCSCLIS